jgi:hypothetical protein
MADSTPSHLLTVWNPAYAEDALDAHLRVLLRWAERARDPVLGIGCEGLLVRIARAKGGGSG